MAIIADLIDADTDAIIELGCGYGINLFRLMRLLKDQKFRWFGAEYTESGRSLCAKLADLDGSEPMDVPFIDHAAPDLGFMADVEKPLVFTCHSIEQVSIIPNNYFSILARAAPGVRGVHLEPFGFQADPSAPNSPTHRNFMHDQGWNLNFFSCLKLAEEKGDIRIEHVEIEKYDTTPNNPTSLAVWISTV
ncbi:MAG: hypothetical protein HN403_04490 [Rhodospirillales bacterium]|nr:hypothetical protein [Rhodospirillales bacterium]